MQWETVAWAFTSYDALNWHPLTWLSHALDVQMFGLDPAGHHDVNLLLHVANVVLLFLVLQSATGYLGRSAIVAALFALHPITVESVAWIAERKNLLSMLFFLLALGSYRWYVRKPAVGRYTVVAACFALGLMAKPQVITLPFVLLLWDYWPLQRMATAYSPPSETLAFSPQKLSWLVLEKAPLFLLCVASSVLTMQAQRAGGAVASFVKYPLSVRLENAVVSYLRYIGKVFWPVNLAPMYPHPGSALPKWQVWAALVLLLGITELVLHLRRRRYLLVGWLWFLGMLVPMIGIVQVGHQAMADRYAYLPFVGLFIMVCWGVPDLYAQLAARSARSTRPTEPLIAAQHGPASVFLLVVTCVVLLALSLLTHRQLRYWSDNLVLWSHVSQVIGSNLISEQRMADELLKRGRPGEAMHHFQRAAAISPSDPESNFAIAVYEQKQGSLIDAIQRYKIVVSNTTDQQIRARALTYMSYAYRDLGDSGHARESLQGAESLRR